VCIYIYTYTYTHTHTHTHTHSLKLGGAAMAIISDFGVEGFEQRCHGITRLETKGGRESESESESESEIKRGRERERASVAGGGCMYIT